MWNKIIQTFKISTWFGPNIDNLVNNREEFDKFIYTPLEEALKELERRKKDPILQNKINKALGKDKIKTLLERPKAVLFRQLATPNYEIRRFLSIVDSIDELEPLFLEYCDDKFASKNQWKHSLGKINFYEGKDKKNNPIVSKKSIFDFAKYDGKKISAINTLNNLPLVSFHHSLFKDTFIDIKDFSFYDGSKWFEKNGKFASEYYKKLLWYFVSNSILFENFMLEDKHEMHFTKKIILPVILKIKEITGFKPLIVALEPTNIEGDNFWLCHPSESKKIIEKKIQNNL